MRLPVIAGIVTAAIMASTVPKTQPGVSVTASFPGSSLRWVHIAEAEFKRARLDVNKYVVTVYDQGDCVWVVLSEWGLDDPRRKHVRGNMGDRLVGFEVQISKKDGRVLAAKYTA